MYLTVNVTLPDILVHHRKLQTAILPKDSLVERARHSRFALCSGQALQHFTDDLPDLTVSEPDFRRVHVSFPPALTDPASPGHGWASLRLARRVSLTDLKQAAPCLGYPLFCHHWPVKFKRLTPRY